MSKKQLLLETQRLQKQAERALQAQVAQADLARRQRIKQQEADRLRRLYGPPEKAVATSPDVERYFGLVEQSAAMV